MTKFSRVLSTFTALPCLVSGVAAVADDEPVSRAGRRAEVMKRYDSGGDVSVSGGELRSTGEAGPQPGWETGGEGTLSDEERGAERDTRGDRRGRHRSERRRRFDPNAGGVIREERGAAHERPRVERDIRLEK